MGKLSTPDWIREGYDSKEDYEKAKGIKSSSKKGKFKKIKVCPKCGAKEIRVVLGGEEGKGSYVITAGICCPFGKGTPTIIPSSASAGKFSFGIV